MTRAILEFVEIWVESRARPATEPEILLGMRNNGRLASDWIVGIEGTIRLERVGENGKGRLDYEVPFHIRSIGPQESGILRRSLPLLIPGTYRVTIPEIGWVTGKRRRKRGTFRPDVEWEMFFFDTPSVLPIPYTSAPLPPDPESPLFQDPFRAIGGLERLIKEWYTSGKKTLGFYGEGFGGKTTLLRRAELVVLKWVSSDRVLDWYPESPGNREESVTRLIEELKALPPGEKIALIDNILFFPDEARETLLREPDVRLIYTDDILHLRQPGADKVIIPWLSPEAIARLIAVSPVPMDLSVHDAVWEWSGGHPLLTQIILETFCIERQQTGYITQNDVEILSWRATDVHAATMEQLWDRFTWDEKEVLVAVARWSERRREDALWADVIFELERQVQPAARSFAHVFPPLMNWAVLKDPVEGARWLDRSAKRVRKVLGYLEKVKQEIREAKLFKSSLREAGEVLASSAEALRKLSPWLESRFCWDAADLEEGTKHLRGSAEWMQRAVVKMEEIGEILEELEESGHHLEEWARDFQEAERIFQSAAEELRRLSPWLERIPYWPRRTVLRKWINYFRRRVGVHWERIVVAAPALESFMQALGSEFPYLADLEGVLQQLGILPVHWVEKTMKDLTRRGWLVDDEGRGHLRPRLLQRWLQRERVEFSQGGLEPHIREV